MGSHSGLQDRPTLSGQFKYVVELYAQYMKLAFLGMVVCAPLFAFYSAISNYPIGLRALLVLGILAFVVVGIKALRRKTHELKLEQQMRREETAKEFAAQRQRNEQRLEQARNYLKSIDVATISDNREIDSEVLVKDVVVLMERLQAENLSEFVTQKAVHAFLDLVCDTKDSFVYSVRQRLLESVITDTVITNKFLNKNHDSEKPRRAIN